MDSVQFNGFLVNASEMGFLQILSCFLCFVFFNFIVCVQNNVCCFNQHNYCLQFRGLFCSAGDSVIKDFLDDHILVIH